MLILVDMDGTLADFESSFLRLWRESHPDQPYLERDERRTFYVEHDYPQHVQHLIPPIYEAAGFFRDLDPIPGGVAALHDMEARGHEVFICTTPLRAYRYCVTEKLEWVERHLGHDWVRRTVLTYDKTLVHGDILIDDKPRIKGAATPTWEHVIYDQPYNREVNGQRRLTWANWQDVLFGGKE